MKLTLLLFLFIPLIIFSQSADDELINIKEIIPDIVIDQKYNTIDNFTYQKLYTTNECLLAHGAIKKLKLVQDSLRNIKDFNGSIYPSGLGLKVWDGYRPRAIQYLMFEIFPDPTFVADPSTGSVHNRGGAIDLTIIDLATKEELKMPTVFDFFGPEAGHNYNNLPQEVLNNRALLKNLMNNLGGFAIYDSEWWHYTYSPASSYPLLDFQMK